MRKIILILILILNLINAACAEQSARLLFIGDIMAHDQQLKAAKNKNGYDFTPQFRRVAPLFKDEFLIGNLETVFAGNKNKLKYSGYPLFNTPDVLIENLKSSLGIDCLTLANNHIFDKGEAGARRTAEVLENSGVSWTGLALDFKDDLGKIIKSIRLNDAILLTTQGLKFALVNLTYGSNLNLKQEDVKLNIISHENIKQAIDNAKNLEPDIIIACFHWGNEYHFKPSAHQKDAADYALKYGADLIIGTHPHVLQPVEIRDADTQSPKAIAWSLGNFVSFQRTLPRERSVILAVEFIKDDLSNKARITRVSAAPLYVIAPGNFKTEVTYAGFDAATISKLDFKNISKNNLTKLKAVGRAVLEFLGAANLNQADEFGFYTLWDASEPDNLPSLNSKRKSPQ